MPAMCVVYACLWYVVALLLNLCMCVSLGARDTCKFNIYRLNFVVVQYRGGKPAGNQMLFYVQKKIDNESIYILP